MIAVLVWSAILAGTLTGWALRARKVRHRHRAEVVIAAAEWRRTAADWQRTARRLRWQRDSARAERDHAVWELAQAKRVARAHVAALERDRDELERDRDEWRAVARLGWGQYYDLLTTEPAEAAVQAAVAGLDEQLATIIREGAS